MVSLHVLMLLWSVWWFSGGTQTPRREIFFVGSVCFFSCCMNVGTVLVSPLDDRRLATILKLHGLRTPENFHNLVVPFGRVLPSWYLELFHRPSSLRDLMQSLFSEVFNCGHISTSALPMQCICSTTLALTPAFIAVTLRGLAPIFVFQGGHNQGDFPDMWSMIINGKFL